MIAPQWKPSRLERQVAKFKRRQAKAKSKAAEDRRAREEWTVKRKQAYVRDDARCRATGKPVAFLIADPMKQAHCHHVIFRSAGGTDDLSNLVTLSAEAHDLIHRHIWSVTGNANETLHFTARDPETGRIERAWESALSCPPQTVGREG